MASTEDYVASFLLKEGLLLTALELHSELCEEGRPIKILTEYIIEPLPFQTTLSIYFFTPPKRTSTIFELLFHDFFD